MFGGVVSNSQNDVSRGDNLVQSSSGKTSSFFPASYFPLSVFQSNYNEHIVWLGNDFKGSEIRF